MGTLHSNQCWGSANILVRIRILGSVPLTNGSGFGSRILFSSLTFRTATKEFFAYYPTFSIYIYIIFQRLRHKDVTKQNESRFFFLFLLDDRGVREPYLWLLDPDPDPGGPKKIRNLRSRIRNTGSNKQTLKHLTTINNLAEAVLWIRNDMFGTYLNVL
jgi:hypothetical protein